MITDKNKRFLTQFDPHLEDHHIEKLINDGDWAVRESIARHPNLKDHHIEKLINDENQDVRWSIAKNPIYQDYLKRKEHK